MTNKTFTFGLFGGIYTIRARDVHAARAIIRADLREDGLNPARAKSAKLLSVKDDLPDSAYRETGINRRAR